MRKKKHIFPKPLGNCLCTTIMMKLSKKKMSLTCMKPETEVHTIIYMPKAFRRPFN